MAGNHGKHIQWIKESKTIQSDRKRSNNIFREILSNSWEIETLNIQNYDSVNQSIKDWKNIVRETDSEILWMDYSQETEAKILGMRQMLL